MNKTRRKEIETIIDAVEAIRKRYEDCLSEIESIKDEFSDFRDQIEQVCNDEQEYRDNMPEGIADGDKGQQADFAIQQLEEACGYFDNDFEEVSIDDIIQALDEAKQ